MGRPSNANQRLVDAALGPMWEESHGSVTIDHICQRAFGLLGGLVTQARITNDPEILRQLPVIALGLLRVKTPKTAERVTA
jgi:hypothetical protein